MEIKKIVRKKWIIYPEVQGALILVNFCILTLAFIFLLVGLRYYFNQLQKNGMESGLSPSHYYFTFLRTQSVLLYRIVGWVWLWSVILCSAFTLWFSHRVVGPIVRLQNYFLKINPLEKIPVLKFRENDFFKDLPDSINGVLQRK